MEEYGKVRNPKTKMKNFTNCRKNWQIAMIAGPRNKSGSGLPSSQGVIALDHHLSDHDDPDDDHHHYRHLDDDDQVGCCGVSGPEDWQHTAWGSGHQVIILIIIMMMMMIMITMVIMLMMILMIMMMMVIMMTVMITMIMMTNHRKGFHTPAATLQLKVTFSYLLTI